MKWSIIVLLLIIPSVSHAKIICTEGTLAERRARRFKAMTAYRKQLWKTYKKTDRRISKSMRVTSRLLNDVRLKPKSRLLKYYNLRKMLQILSNRFISIDEEIKLMHIRISELEVFTVGY